MKKEPLQAEDRINISRRNFLKIPHQSKEFASLPKAIINPLTCLAYHKIICYNCKDVCKKHISFQGLFFPTILPSCTGCNECLKLCPQNAITLQEINQNYK